MTTRSGLRLAQRSARIAVLVGMAVLTSTGALAARHARVMPSTLGTGRAGTLEGGRWRSSLTDSADVAATIARFHAALAEGDSVAAMALLAPDVVILEAGGIETRDDYRSHHLPGDMAFARAIKGERGPVSVTVRGDVAWASSTSTTVGDYRGRAINSAGAELMVLTRNGSGWRINAIHWSSRPRLARGGRTS